MITKLYIEVEIDHDEECDVSDVLDRVLDNGDLQDALVGHADAQGHTIEVTGAYEVSWPEDHRGHKGQCGTVSCRAMEES